jgi:mRNA interferase RelE/StbE
MSDVTYSVRIKRSAAKALVRINGIDRRRLVEKIDSLAENPHVGSALKGEWNGLRRVRVGKYRIVFEVMNDVLTVLVVRVGHRSGIYRD